jgi:hypothetical protein
MTAKLKTVAEVAEENRNAFLKAHGLEDPEVVAYRNKAEAISISNHLGKLDHVKESELRQILAHKSDGSIDWKLICGKS